METALLVLLTLTLAGVLGLLFFVYRLGSWRYEVMNRLHLLDKHLNTVGVQVNKVERWVSRQSPPEQAGTVKPEEVERLRPVQPVAIAPQPELISAWDAPGEIPPAPIPPFDAAAFDEELKRDTQRAPRGVEIENGELRLSKSLAAVGSLVPPEGKDALFRLRINEGVHIDEFDFRKWSPWFDFGNGRANRPYRTVEPALVDWNDATERGQLLRRGVAREF